MTLGHSGADRPGERADAAHETVPPAVPSAGATAADETGRGAPAEGAAGGDGAAPAAGRRRAGGRPRLTFMQELPFLVVAALLLAILIKAFLVQAFYIPSGSMERTLHGCDGCRGDRVMVNKLVYHLHDIRRGDVVVFDGKDNYADRQPFGTDTGGNPVSRAAHKVADWVGLAPEGTDYIKRVIGLPGDKVACCDDRGRVTVNGHALVEPYVFIDQTGYQMTFQQVVVPPGHIFVMGDHRNDSYDSRAQDVGPIPTHDVVGRAFVRIWPPSRWGWLGRPDTFSDWPSHTAAAATPLALSTALVSGAAVLRRRVRRRRRAAR